MANTANTAWKLTDLWNTALFTFDKTNGWHPTNENQSVELTGDEYNVPWDNLVQKIDFGLGGRVITFQGEELDRKEVWQLSSTICRRQLMKLWAGNDYFYYVLGVEPRQVRDQSLPNEKSYTAAFKAMDPYLYFSNSASGSGTGKNLVVPTTVVGAAWNTKASAIIINLTASGTDKGTTSLEPVYWIIGGTDTSITKVVITDQLGRQAEYTPQTTIANDHVHVIMPLRNTVLEGYQVNDATGFSVVSGTSSTYITEPAGTMGGAVSAVGTWAGDAFNHGAGTDVSATAAANTYGFITEEDPVFTSRNGSTFLEKHREYPLALDGVSNTHTVTITGTDTDAKVFAQYCVRRV